jgi:hypothetical protein
MSACRPARHAATIRRAALSPARADRIDRPVDLRFLAVDGGMGTRRWSFHGIVRSGRGERGAGEWGVAALVPKAPPIMDMCEAPMPCIPPIPTRSNAAVAIRLTPMTTQTTQRLFMTLLLICSFELQNLGDAEMRLRHNSDALRDLFGSTARGEFPR